MPGMKSLPLARIIELLNTQPAKWACYIALGVPTGCRVSELIPLRRGDLITDDGVLYDPVRFLKLKSRSGSKSRTLSIPDVFQPYIIRHLHAEAERGYTRAEDWVFRGHAEMHLSRFTVYNHFRSLLGTGYGTHWPRKTYAQEMFRYYLQQNTADPMRALELTRRAIGHERLDTTVKYLGIEDDDIRKAQNHVFGQITK